MDGSAPIVSISDRLRERLEAIDPPLSQGELADKSGVDRSLISRILQGSRPPTGDVLRRLAPALDINVEDLVRGTNAESRLQDGSEEALTVRHSVYTEALRRNAEADRKNCELEERLRDEVARRERAESAVSSVFQESESMKRDLAELRETVRIQERQIRETRGSEERYKRMFSDALSQLQALNLHVDELKKLVNSTSDELTAARKSGRLGVILSGIAAVTGAATLAHFFTKDTERSQSEAKVKVKSKSKVTK